MNHSSFQFNQRSGLSIIEVLTSIVVAMIGVFGVMVLIPFAVKQAQAGLDGDAAVVSARNAYSQFEIKGYRIPNNWSFHRTAEGVVDAYSPFEPVFDYDGDTVDDPDPPKMFSIDPLGVSANGDVTISATYDSAVFPFNGVALGTAYPAPLLIEAASLGTPTGAIMTNEVARQMFLSPDELVFGEQVDDLFGPEQYYFTAADGTQLSRQTLGRLSWSAIVMPVTDNPTAAAVPARWSYRMFILVYKERRTSLLDPEGQMKTARLEPRQNVGFQTPVSTIYLEPGVAVESTASTAGVQRDDWVMLINRFKNTTDDAAPAFHQKGFDRQVGFYRVVGVTDGFGTPAAANRTTLAALTLDGPDFNFGDPAGTDATIDPDGLIQETYVVHLKDVVGVYERTFAPEFESNWTN